MKQLKLRHWWIGSGMAALMLIDTRIITLLIASKNDNVAAGFVSIVMSICLTILLVCLIVEGKSLD